MLICSLSNMKFLLISAVVLGSFLSQQLSAERMLIEVFQPTSLLGTELDSDPFENGESLPATIVSRPVIVEGAVPEGVVHAISLPHRIAGASENFPNESNLVVLVGGSVYAEYGEKEHQVFADFSKAKLPDNLGVTMMQVMKLTGICLQKTLVGTSQKSIRITWIAPEGVSLMEAELPLEIEKKSKE